MYSDSGDYELLVFICVIVNFRSFTKSAQIILKRTLVLSWESSKKVDASLNVNVRRATENYADL